MNSSIQTAYKSAKPTACYFDERHKVFHLFAENENIDFGLRRYKANPFILHEPMEDPEFEFQIEYTGPSEVIYDPVNNCIVPFNEANVFFMPTKETCERLHDNSHLKFWKKSCHKVHFQDPHTVQIKMVDDSQYYVFCAGFKIRAFKNIVDCPSHVFAVPRDEIIEIIG